MKMTLVILCATHNSQEAVQEAREDESTLTIIVCYKLTLWNRDDDWVQKETTIP